MRFKDRVVVISGGSRGIGREVVLSFAKQGAKVAFTYSNNQKAADEVVAQAHQYTENVVAYQVDSKDYEKVKKFSVNIVSKWDCIDILVNNAGIKKDKMMVMLTESDWKDVVDTNLTGVFNFAKNVGFHMLKNKKGRIINVTSISGIYGMAGQTNYSSSKSGIIGLTKAFAKEVAPYGICVNAVAPGGVDTDMVSEMPEKERQKLIRDVPIGRLCRTEEVAKTILFLADTGASPDYLTGSVITLDGGMGL